MSAVDQHDDVVIDDTTSSALAVRQPVALSVTPDVKASELTVRLDVIREAMNSAMVANIDYGVIPGTDKPTLLKPGAEKLGVLFQLDVQLVNERERDDAHLTVTSHATVYHAPTGARLGYGEGMCSTYEKKYRYRNASRVCPVCGKDAIIKGKEEYGGGWLCFKKKDGCGAKFQDDDPKIVNQKVGQVENPDLPDAWNTVLKMAEKRARVDAILAVTGASALFTQDAEDFSEGGPQAPKVSAPADDRGEASSPSDVPAALAPDDDDDPERAQNAGDLLRLAHDLGAYDVMAEAMRKHRASHSLADHKEWQRDAIKRAHLKIAALADEQIEFGEPTT